jgi:hypothetical protein
LTTIIDGLFGESREKPLDSVKNANSQRKGNQSIDNAKCDPVPKAFTIGVNGEEHKLQSMVHELDVNREEKGISVQHERSLFVVGR